MIPDAIESAGSKLSDWVAILLGEWAANKVDSVLIVVSRFWPEIVTLGVVLCAMGMMVPGIDPKPWFNRLVSVFWVGLVVAMLI